MKLNTLRQKLTAMGATLEMNDYDLIADAPDGHVWEANSCQSLVEPYANNSQKWLRLAVKELWERAKLGAYKPIDP